MEKDVRKYPPVSGMSREQHEGVVTDIFSSVSRSYDILNRFLSMRRDVAWRRALVGRMRFFRTNRLLDVATGTADVALEAARKYPGIEITGLDPSAAMLEVGREKVARAGLGRRITLIEGDALNLPFPGASFDAVSVAFGMRNIPDKAGALREMMRVAVPGGAVMVLEMGLPESGLFREVYIRHLGKVMPAMARVFSSNPAAYEYLADSIINFPGPREFKSLMESAGLADIEIIELTLGITRLFVGRKFE